MLTDAQPWKKSTQPAWLRRFAGRESGACVWTLYLDGRRYAVAKKAGKVPEYHIFEKGSVSSVEDRSKHRLLWSGRLTRAGRDYLEQTLALSNSADRIMRVNGEAQCALCHQLASLSELEGHACRKDGNDG